MSDLWAYCDPCGRWFYPDSRNRPTHDASACPVCSTEALTFARQPEATTA